LELSELNILIKLLRANGVTEYTAPNGLSLKLGPVQADDVDAIARKPVLSDGAQRLRDVMRDHLDPIYSDPSLFDIR
jgi:hypothetical protein